MTAQSYDIIDYLRQKRRAVDAWADLLSTITGEQG